MNNTLDKEIKSSLLFQSLSDDEIKELKKIVTIKKLSPDEILFYEGELPTTLYLLVSGLIRVYKTNKNGNELVINEFTSNSLIAEVAIFEQMPYPATAKSTGDSVVLSIKYEEFKNKFLPNPIISLKIISSFSKKIKYLENFIENSIKLTSTQKVAKFIYFNEDKFTTLKQREISTLLYITPETLSRVLKKFKDKKIIDKENYTHFRVIDREALKEYFGE